MRLTARVAALLLVPVVLCAGCKDDEIAKAVNGFRAASVALAGAYGTFVANANTVEEENYINRIVETPKLFDPKALNDVDLMTPEQVAVRGAAITALGDYLAALATLEAGGSSAQIEADAATAGTSLATLDTHVTKAVANHTGFKLYDISGPTSAAVAAIGSVLKLILAHKGRAEVKKSILDNDAAVQALFAKIAEESKDLYARQQAAAGKQRTATVTAFDAEVTRAGTAPTPGLVDLGERLKATPRAMASVAGADPKNAIATFQKTHDALIKVVNEDGKNKESLRELVGDVQRFAAEVGPLVTNLQAFVSSF